MEVLEKECSALDLQAHHYARSPADAEDALADATVQFLCHYEGPPGQDAARWMMAVIRNCARKGAMRSARWQDPRRIGSTDVDDTHAVIVSDFRRGPLETLISAEEAAAILRAIDKLKPDERRALLLRGLGYTYREIARIEHWSARKVRRCISEGRATARKSSERGGKP